MELKFKHLLYDIWVEDNTPLQQVEPMRKIMTDAICLAGATIINQQFHQFSPFGYTGLFLLAESHVSIHTWPEKSYASLDVFTCGSIDAESIIHRIREHFQIHNEKLICVERGIM